MEEEEEVEEADEGRGVVEEEAAAMVCVEGSWRLRCAACCCVDALNAMTG